MDKSILVKIFGFWATLIHGDPLVLDRWRYIKKKLPETRGGEKLIDIGCGSGAFTIGAALRGYSSLGVSWDERNQSIASQRAELCGTDKASFEVFDVRELDLNSEWNEAFDVVICLENIEHIIDDAKLIQDMAACLKPGGRILLSTPYYYFRPISLEEKGPYYEIEDGRHVRRGYTKCMLNELLDSAGLSVEEISYVSGFMSQKICYLQRLIAHKIHPLVAWLVILPLRVLPPIFDRFIEKITGWPNYSICVESIKPRINGNASCRRV